MILSGRRSAGAEESIEVLLANRRRGRPNEASRLHGTLIVVLFAFPAIEVRVHPARRGVAHPRRVLVAEDGVREEGGGDRTALTRPFAPVRLSGCRGTSAPGRCRRGYQDSSATRRCCCMEAPEPAIAMVWRGTPNRLMKYSFVFIAVSAEIRSLHWCRAR